MTLTYVVNDLRQVLVVSRYSLKKLLIVKVSNYFTALHEESDNFKQRERERERERERYEMDEFKEYNFQNDF